MQMPGFILHGWLCYYNDGEVVKKNIDLSPLKSINSFEIVIRIAYGMKKESKQAGPHGLSLTHCPGCGGIRVHGDHHN